MTHYGLLITESEKTRILSQHYSYFPLHEQGVRTPDGAIVGPGGIMSPKEVAAADKRIKTVFTDPHIILPILEIGTFFIPVVGPFIAMGIGMADAALYYKEGDKKTASLVAVLSLLPGAGAIVKKIPGVKTLGKKGMIELAKKLGKSTKPALTKTEIEVVKGLTKNKTLVQNYAKNHLRIVGKKAINSGKSVSPQVKAGVIDFIKTGVVKTGKGAKTVGKAVAPYVAAGYATLEAYEAAATAGKLGPIEYIKTIGYTEKDWPILKRVFGTDKTGKGNMKIVAALKDGWRLGNPIPQEHQTASYKKFYAEEQAALKKLESLL